MRQGVDLNKHLEELEALIFKEFRLMAHKNLHILVQRCRKAFVYLFKTNTSSTRYNGVTTIMVTIPEKEKLIRESIKFAKISVDKLKLERAFYQHSLNADISEEFNEIVCFFISSSTNIEEKNIGKIQKDCYLIASKFQAITEKYKDFVEEELSEKTESLAITMNLLGDAYGALLDLDDELEENSSLNTLRKWNKWASILAELIEVSPQAFGCDTKTWLMGVAKKIMLVTGRIDPKQTRKNKYKRSLRRSASLILIQLQNGRSYGSWNLVIGESSYEELLRKSQENIHRLDELEPKTEEEAIEQEETLNFLLRELTDEN